MPDTLRFKLRRSDEFTLESYGPDVHRALDRLIGGKEKWDLTKDHGAARLGRTRARVERHEDGPEIIGLLIEQLPNYVTALSALVSLWFARPKKKPKSTAIRVEVGGLTIEGPLHNPRDVKRAVALLKSLAK